MEVLRGMELTPTDAREEGLIYRLITQCNVEGYPLQITAPGYHHLIFIDFGREIDFVFPG